MTITESITQRVLKLKKILEYLISLCVPVSLSLSLSLSLSHTHIQYFEDKEMGPGNLTTTLKVSQLVFRNPDISLELSSSATRPGLIPLHLPNFFLLFLLRSPQRVKPNAINSVNKIPQGREK